MADRTHKINFALNSIPTYNGDPNKLSTFINAVNTIQTILGTLNPPLDDFDKEIAFLHIKSKITEKALDSIKDTDFSSWNNLRTHLINNFKDRTNSVTILNDILKIQHIKNPYKLLEITKEKYLSFKSRISIEENDNSKKIAIINYAEKLIVSNFISSIQDPFKNNLATRNPANISEIETLLQNDFQYLKISNKFQTSQDFPNTSQSRFPREPFNTKLAQNKPMRPFAPRQNVQNAQGMKTTPMSIQTRQTFQPRKFNHFQPQTQTSPHYTVKELYNNDDYYERNENFENYDNFENYENSEKYNETEIDQNCENDETEPSVPLQNSFLDAISLEIQEKS